MAARKTLSLCFTESIIRSHSNIFRPCKLNSRSSRKNKFKKKDSKNNKTVHLQVHQHRKYKPSLFRSFQIHHNNTHPIWDKERNLWVLCKLQVNKWMVPSPKTVTSRTISQRTGTPFQWLQYKMRLRHRAFRTHLLKHCMKVQELKCRNHNKINIALARHLLKRWTKAWSWSSRFILLTCLIWRRLNKTLRLSRISFYHQLIKLA